ncbi:MAG: hypothetical protein R3185_02065 [Candidatus Thermoplasmatota archaeon]|nr:hypothetical protein [Candidatus Thermoplasmatota archaeon]
MRAGALLAAILLASGMAGCIDVGERWDDLQNDLRVEPRFTQTILFEEEQAFSFSGALDPTSPPQGASDVGANWTTSFPVPEGTRSMRVLFVVNFTQAPPSPPDPLPSPTNQEGEVRVFVRPANASANETQDEFYQASGAGGFDFRRPAGGDWTIGFDQAIGEGTVSFRVEAQVPV